MTDHRCPECGYDPTAKIKGITFVASSREIRMGGKSCVVSSSEIDLIEELLDTYPRIVSMEHLLEILYVHNVDMERETLAVHISKIRKTLRDAGLGFTISYATKVGGYRIELLEGVHA